MTAVEKAERDGQLFRAYLRGLTPPQLAETFELGPDAVRKILDEQRERARGPLVRPADEIVDEMAMRLEEAAAELAQISATEKGSARVAAVRAKLEVWRDLIELLQRAGHLPRDLGTVRLDVDVKVVAAAIFRAMDEHDVPEKAIGAVVAELERATGREVGEGEKAA